MIAPGYSHGGMLRGVVDVHFRSADAAAKAAHILSSEKDFFLRQRFFQPAHRSVVILFCRLFAHQ